MPPTAPVPVAARLAPVQVIAPPPRAPGPQGSVANMLAMNAPPSPGDQVYYLSEKDLTRDELVADPWRMPYRGPESFRNGLYHGQETWERRREYRELNRLEPAVRAAIQLKAANIASLKLSVHPRDKTKPLDVKAAKFFKWTLERCPEGPDGVLRELLTPAFVDGWAVSEYTLEGIKDDVEWYGYHGLVHVTAKDTDYVKLETDEFRNVLRVVNIVRGLEYFNKEKFLIYTHNGMYANPFGQSDIAAAYRSAKIIDQAYQLWFYAAQTYGSPFIKGIFNSDQAGFKEQFEDVLRNMRANGYGAIKKSGPDDITDIEVVNLAAATSFDQFERMVDKLRQEIWTAIHGTYLPFTEGSGKDPRGNTEISQDVGPDPLSFLLALSAARCLERQLAAPVTMANFGPGAGCPRIMLGGIDYAEVNRILDVAKKMLEDFKQPISKDWLREVTQVPEGDHDDDRIMPPDQGGPGGPDGGPGGPGGQLALPPSPTAGGPGGGGGTGPSPGPDVTGAASPSPGTTTSPSPNAPADPADQTPESDQSQNSENWEHPEDAEIVQAAMAKAQADGDTQTVRKLTELGSDPEALAALLADLDGPPDEKDDTPPDRRSYAWRAGTSRNGAIKAISDSGQPTVYGERARKLLENQDRVSRGETPAPRKVGGAAASAAARKQAAETGVRRVARDVWAASKQNPAFVKPHELEGLSEHLHSLTAAELAQHLKDVGKRVSGLKADKVARLLEHIRGGPAAPEKTAEAKPGPGVVPENPEPGKVYQLHSDDLKMDPKRFQYKVSGIGEGGVTNELKNVDYNPMLAGTILAWKDPATGEIHPVNGHHRTDLRKRTGGGLMNVMFTAAPTAAAARSDGALMNLAEGRGTAIDAAKYMRDSGADLETLKRAGISMSGKMIQDATALRDLNDGAFQKLAEGRLDEAQAIAVAKHMKDPKLQDELFAKLQKREEDGKDWSTREVETAAKKMASAGKVATSGSDLFGDWQDEDSTFDQEVELESHIGRALSQAVNDYHAVANTGRAERVAGAGNTLAVEENAKRRDRAAAEAETFNQLVNRSGPIADAVKQSAAELAAAKTKREKERVKQSATDRVRAAIATELGDKPKPGTVPVESGGVNGERGPGAGNDEQTPGARGPGAEKVREPAVTPGGKPDDADTTRPADATSPPPPTAHESTPEPEPGAKPNKLADEPVRKEAELKEARAGTDLFGRPIPKAFRSPSGSQLTLDDAAKAAWTGKAEEWAAENGGKPIDKWDAGGRFQSGGKWYQVGKAEDGYPVEPVDKTEPPAPRVSKKIGELDYPKPSGVVHVDKHGGKGRATDEQRAAAQKVIGDLSPEHLAALTSAPHGAELHVSHDPKHPHSVTIATRHEGVKTSRTLKRRGNKLSLENNYLRIEPDSPHAGKGAHLLATQAQAAHAAGIPKMSTFAAGNHNLAQYDTGMNGYYTWPRLGYDGEIGKAALKKLPPELKQQLGDSRSIRDLMATKAGRDFWHRHGKQHEATFDTSPEGKSVATLNQYLEDKASGRTGPSRRPKPAPADSGPPGDSRGEGGPGGVGGSGAGANPPVARETQDGGPAGRGAGLSGPAGVEPGAKSGGKMSGNQYNESVVRPMQTGELAAPAAAQPGAQTEHAATVSKWAEKSTASPEHKAKFREDMTHVLSKLPPASAKAAVEALNDGSVTLHGDIASVEGAYAKASGGKSAKGVVGFVQSRPGDDRAHMHVDGDGGTASDLVARAIYSHEMGHAIDAGNRYSGDAKWKSAWKSEIFNGRTLLSRYARTNEAEGFAELYKLIAEKGLDTAELSYPKCVKFLKSKGLV